VTAKSNRSQCKSMSPQDGLKALGGVRWHP
jgi:hypothetical protein